MNEQDINERIFRERIESLSLALSRLKAETLTNMHAYKALRKRIMQVKNARLFKIVILFNRFQIEFLKGGVEGKKHFLRWILFKLTGRPRTGHAPLTAFDPFPLYDLPFDAFEQGSTKECHATVPRAKMHFFLFGSLPYNDTGGGQRSAQLTKTLVSQGYDLTYIYAFPRDESKDVCVNIPFTEHYYLSEVSEQMLLSSIRGRPVFIFEIPFRQFTPYLKLASRIRARTIYDHIDNWNTSLGEAFFSWDVLDYFLNNADLLVASAKALVAQLAEKAGDKTVSYLPNAYDQEIFEPIKDYERPKDTPYGEKIFLYAGSLWGEWFCWDWLIVAAESYPNYIFLLIGDCPKRRPLPRNVILLGLKAQSDIPPYLAYCDVALIPFSPGPITDAVSPIKVFEYLGMRKPVISTRMPETQDYPGVYQAVNITDWLELLEKDLKVPDSIDVFNIENTWNRRCEVLIDLVGGPKISIIILCYNNAGVIGRCIDSLIKFDGYGYEIIVVDNQSQDGSLELLKGYGEKIKILTNDKNGCSSGRNLGASEAEGEFLVFIDSDQWATHSRWLNPAFDIFAASRYIGAIGWTAGWFEPGRVSGPNAAFLHNRGFYRSASGVKYRCDVAYIGTGGMIIPRYVWEQTGGFDEAYDPTCFEDTDLSLQIKFCGFEVAYCPFIGLGHLSNQTTESGGPEHRELFKRNGDYFYHKWSLKAPELLKVYLDD
jgi:GT2 family glycosyltransferase/glycosyltransferase involved in cell wall biosynthesis